MAAYATAAEYRDRMGLSSADNDDTILEQLEAISRVLDRKLHIFAGDLAPTETATRLFVLERPGKKLWLRDDAGHAHFLRSVSGITIDGDALATSDVGLRPLNQEMKTAILRVSGTWTANVEIAITGAWGLGSIHPAAREWTIGQTRNLRDTESGGAAGRVEVIDSDMVMRDEQWRILRQLAATLSRDVGLRR